MRSLLYAEFHLQPILYFAYVNNLEEGDLITSEISASKTFSVSINNIKSVDVELSLKDPDTGKKEWNSLHRVAAS